MSLNRREQTDVMRWVLLLSAFTWLLLVVNPGGLLTGAHAPVSHPGTSHHVIQVLPTGTRFLSWMVGWGLMLIAMMSPTLIPPVCHILGCSFKRRRTRAVALFALGYAGIWVAAGLVLQGLVLALNALAPHAWWPVIGAGAVACVWQCSPLKQRCLNRGHNHTELAAFGLRADWDVFRFGVTHGVWCVGSCWVLMLLPMLMHTGHLVTMMAVTFIMISERLEAPKSLRWRLHFPNKLLRLAIAQTRLRLKRRLAPLRLLPGARNEPLS